MFGGVWIYFFTFLFNLSRHALEISHPYNRMYPDEAFSQQNMFGRDVKAGKHKFVMCKQYADGPMSSVWT